MLAANGRLSTVAPRQRLADVAFERIRRDIVLCVLKPGTYVTERQLAAHVSLGKAPVRAALQQLGRLGLVRAVPRHGYWVAPITLKDVNEIFELRLAIEPRAAGKAAGRVDVERLARLDALCQAGYLVGDKASEIEFLRVNRELHVTVAAASGNARLAELLGQLLDEMERLFHLGLPLLDLSETFRHDHRKLVDALARGDGLAAEQAAVEHIETNRRMVMAGILQSPDILNVNIMAS